MNSLTIFFPFYNDAGTVERMINDAFFYGRKLTNDLEVIAVNDGSMDNTLLQLQKAKQVHPKLIVINHEDNRGYGGAIISGIRNSTKEWVFYTDGDAQYHLDELEKLWNLRMNVEVINGFKLNRADGRIRKFVGEVYRLFIKLLFKIPVKDIDCDYRLMRGSLVRELDLNSFSGAITVELIKKLSIKTRKIIEVGVYHYDRVYGRSTFFNFKKIWETIIEEVKLLHYFQKIK